MQSLLQLTVDKLNNILPQDCLDHLVEKYLQDQVYDLTTFVETSKPLGKGWFIMFADYGYDHLPFFLTIRQTTNGEVLSFPFEDCLIDSIYAYWIPRSIFSGIIYTEKGPTLKSKFYFTHKDDILSHVKSIYSYWPTLDIIKDSISEGISNFPTNLKIRYYIPPSYMLS